LDIGKINQASPDSIRSSEVEGRLQPPFSSSGFNETPPTLRRRRSHQRSPDSVF